MFKNILKKNFPDIFKLVKKLKPTNYDFLLGLPTITPEDYIKKVLSMDEANNTILETLNSRNSCFITRFGSAELRVVINYEYLKSRKVNYWDYKRLDQNIFRFNAVFPRNDDTLERFAKLYLDCIKNIDVLGVWYNHGEQILHKKYFSNANLIPIEALEPFRFSHPWSKALTNKKVLVILPFEKTVQSQYQRRELLFQNNNILPDFELITYRPFNAYVDAPAYNHDWFDYLKLMCEDVSKIEFDIALIGAGPFGLPLGNYIKMMGKKAVHIGGALQLMFGIKGNRWESRSEFLSFMNEYWVKPPSEDTPPDFKKNKIDDGAYW